MWSKHAGIHVLEDSTICYIDFICKCVPFFNRHLYLVETAAGEDVFNVLLKECLACKGEHLFSVDTIGVISSPVYGVKTYEVMETKQLEKQNEKPKRPRS